MNAYAKIGAALLVFLLGIASGWMVQGWRQAEKIAELQKTRSDEISAQVKAALDNLTEASANIKTQAAGASTGNANLSAKIDLVRKDLKNAQKVPLVVGCKPDTQRLRNLAAAIAAVNDATAAGSVSGK